MTDPPARRWPRRLRALALATAALAALAPPTAHLWLPPLVDAARAVIGFGRMHRIEQAAFELLDDPVDHNDDSVDLHDPGAPRLSPPRPGLEILWPPAPLTLALPPSAAFPHEGRWEAFDAPCPQGAAPREGAMVRADLRVDPRRPDVEVSLVAMDMRRLELRLMPGDAGGPEGSAGGPAGGAIPQGDLGALVAAFNGGFQRQHGGFGLVHQRATLLEPLKGAATLATGPRGRLWMGSWQGPGEGVDVVDLRQNLQLLVEDGAINPDLWLVADGRRETIGHSATRRSGLCVRPPFTLIYLWTLRGQAESLGRAMIVAGCARGMHLDLNAFHTRFEALRVLDDGQSCEARLHPAMTDGPPRRYLSPQRRDFFALLARPSPLDDAPVVLSLEALGAR